MDNMWLKMGGFTDAVYHKTDSGFFIAFASTLLYYDCIGFDIFSSVNVKTNPFPICYYYLTERSVYYEAE